MTSKYLGRRYSGLLCLGLACGLLFIHGVLVTRRPDNTEPAVQASQDVPLTFPILQGGSANATSPTIPKQESQRLKQETPGWKPNCSRLFAGDQDYAFLVHQKTKNMKMKTDLVLEKQLRELEHEQCNRFLSSRQYPSVPSSKEEAMFPLAFSILLYKDVGRVERLLRAIYQPQNVYCLHVDRKAPLPVHDAIRRLAACFDNVLVAHKSTNVVWGYFGVLEADLICMEELLRSTTRWRYFINLTGQEFPLKTNLELVRILNVYNGANDIFAYSPNRSLPFIHRVKYVHRLKPDGRSWFRTPYLKGPLPYNLTYMKGRVHITASWEFVNFTMNSHKAQHLAEWLRDTGIPDETFFPLLQHSGQLGAPGADKEAFDQEAQRPLNDTVNRYKVFYSRSPDCKGKFLRNICIFGLLDLPSLYNKGVRGLPLFVNKLLPEYQPVAYDCLEELHLNRSRMVDRTLDTQTYEQLLFVQRYHKTYG